MGPPVAMAWMVLLWHNGVDRASRSNSVDDNPLGATLFMVTSWLLCGNCINGSPMVWQHQWIPLWYNGNNNAPHGTMALTILPMVQWCSQPSLWRYSLHNIPCDEGVDGAPCSSWHWQLAPWHNGIDCSAMMALMTLSWQWRWGCSPWQQRQGCSCHNEGKVGTHGYGSKGTPVARGGEGVWRLMKRNFSIFCFVVFCEIFLLVKINIIYIYAVSLDIFYKYFLFLCKLN